MDDVPFFGYIVRWIRRKGEKVLLAIRVLFSPVVPSLSLPFDLWMTAHSFLFFLSVLHLLTSLDPLLCRGADPDAAGRVASHGSAEGAAAKTGSRLRV